MTESSRHPAPPPALAASELSVALGGRPVLRGVSLEVRRGELLGLLGPNGAGKTTLLRTMAGLLRPRAGRVLSEGQDLWSLSPRQRARRLAYLPQRPDCAWPMAAEAVVALGRLPFGTHDQPETRRAVIAAMRETDCLHLADRPVRELSGGERARVFLARALAGETGILLADEPVADLDPAHQLAVMELLQARARAGAAVVAVLHDLPLAARFCDRVAVIDRGRVLADDAPAAAMTTQTLGRTFGVVVHSAVVDGTPLVVPLHRLPPTSA